MNNSSQKTFQTNNKTQPYGNVAQSIARSLLRHEIRLIFGQSIPSSLLLACEDLGIQQIGYRTENAGGYMADAYARITGKASVITAQNGPAATLLVPALAEALKASIPIVALVQDINRSNTDRNAFQEYDHIGLFAPCTKWARRVTQASRIGDYLDQAFTHACSGRPGPVALMLPEDLLIEPAFEEPRSICLSHFPLDRVVADPAKITEAAQRLCTATAPVIIAGGGVHISDASAALAMLQQDAHLPVATTTMGKGSVDERHPLSIGVVGSFMGPCSATRWQRPLIADADVVLLIGNRTNQNGTDSWKLYPKNAFYIHIDIDSGEVGRNYESLRLVGDARETILALHKAITHNDLSKRQQQRSAIETKIANGRAAYENESNSIRHSGKKPIRPERLMEEIEQQLDEETIIVADASYASTWVANYLVGRSPGMRFLTPRGLAGLGWGFPMALGAKLAKPKATVICVVGDGGFGHVWSELETAKRHGINIILIVLNNGILGFQKHAEDLKYQKHTSAVDFSPVDHAAIARACGCDGIQIRDPENLKQSLLEAQTSQSTSVLDVICDPEAFPPLTFFSPELN